VGIGAKIKEARELKGLTQRQLAVMIGVTSSAITNYEKELSHPKEPVLYRLIQALEVDANFLFEEYFARKDEGLTSHESRFIKKYRALDERGRGTVDGMLDIEYNRAIMDQTQATVPAKKVGGGIS